MYIFNQINSWRNKNTKGCFYEIKLKLFYLIRNLFGFCRGLLISLTGKIRYTDSYIPLIIGARTELLIRPGSSIILKYDQELLDENMYPNNAIFLTASTIGTRPHFLALDPPAISTTRIELLGDAELILGQNTIILPGSYITGNNATIKIGKNCYISQEVIINSRYLIEIGKNVLIGYQVMMMDYDGHTIVYSDGQKQDSRSKKKTSIIIGDNVWIGARVTILKGVTIGSGTIIGANSCVVSDIPPNTIAVGNPAKVIKDNIIWQR